MMELNNATTETTAKESTTMGGSSSHSRRNSWSPGVSSTIADDAPSDGRSEMSSIISDDPLSDEIEISRGRSMPEIYDDGYVERGSDAPAAKKSKNFISPMHGKSFDNVSPNSRSGDVHITPAVRAASSDIVDGAKVVSDLVERESDAPAAKKNISLTHGKSFCDTFDTVSLSRNSRCGDVHITPAFRAESSDIVDDTPVDEATIVSDLSASVRNRPPPGGSPPRKGKAYVDNDSKKTESTFLESMYDAICDVCVCLRLDTNARSNFGMQKKEERKRDADDTFLGKNITCHAADVDDFGCGGCVSL